MNELRHHTVQANGIRMKVAERGAGPLLLLCHGWPETWYAWRHQIAPLAERGFRVAAPDLRGFGGSDAPPDVDAYHVLHLVGDLVQLVAQLGEDRAILIGHDWGATLAWYAALLRPDVFPAVAALSVPFPKRSSTAPVATLRARGQEGFYWVYFQTPGVAEAEFERDVPLVLRKLWYASSGDAPETHRLQLMVQPAAGLLDAIPAPAVLPPWLSSTDVATVAAEFERTGFRGGLNWYRNIDRNWELTEPWHAAQLRVPALFIAGSREPLLKHAAGARALAEMSKCVPRLTAPLLIEGAGHWVQEERPTEVNAALLSFLRPYEVRSR
jgi:pimeloyl-ACP methyl ester carboxylesterase